MLKVLFLDIDGVLMCEDEYRRGGSVKRQFPGKRAPLILEACSRGGAVVVCSSTWRHSDDTRDMLLHHGFPMHPDWRTPLNSRNAAGTLILGDLRGHEIKLWLDAHPEVSGYAIIDDDSDMLPEQMGRFVKTDFATGIECWHVDAILDALSLPLSAALTPHQGETR